MRALQFWILVLASTLVSALMIKQIFLSRALVEEHRVLLDSQNVASTATGFDNAWRQLALHIYQASANDPALEELLKKADVRVRPVQSPDAASPPTPPTEAPSPSPKPPVAQPQSVTP